MEQGEAQTKAGEQGQLHAQGQPYAQERTSASAPSPDQEAAQGAASAQAQARQERLEETAALLKRCFHKMQRGERSSQGHVMGLLWRKGELTQRELQSYMKISQASLSELVKKLEERGMVERSADPDDRRRVLVRLTEQGRRDHQEHLKRSLDRGVALLDVLDPAEQDELYRLLQKMLAGSEALEAGGSASASGSVPAAAPDLAAAGTAPVPAAEPAPTPAAKAPEGGVSRR